MDITGQAASSTIGARVSVSDAWEIMGVFNILGLGVCQKAALQWVKYLLVCMKGTL